MIGILGAMSVEIRGLMASLEQAKEQRVGHMRFVSGRLYGREAVLADAYEEFYQDWMNSPAAKDY